MEYDDWIELYNTGKDTVDVRGLYMTNDLAFPLKYKLPFKGTQNEFHPGIHSPRQMDNLSRTLHLDFNLEKRSEIAIVNSYRTTGCAGFSCTKSIPIIPSGGTVMVRTDGLSCQA
jgi:hypothetical protein